MDIEARLEYIIFENKANHYVVAGFSELKTYHNFTAAGRIEDPIEDQEYVLQGEYVKHPKYGEQFRVDMAKRNCQTIRMRSFIFFVVRIFLRLVKKQPKVFMRLLARIV